MNQQKANNTEPVGQETQNAGAPELPAHTNIDESKVPDYVLPDPLVLANGERVTDSQTWIDKRRPEIIRLFEEHQEGITPNKKLSPIYEIFEENAPVFDGKARRTQVRIRFSNEKETPVIRVMIHVPSEAETPVPTLLHLGFSPSVLILDEPGLDEGTVWSGKSKTRIPDRKAVRVGDFNIKYFLEKGYGVAYVYYGDIDPDHQDGAPHGIRALFGPQVQPRKSNEWGTIASWSWGLSRILDYLEMNPDVDDKKVALSGVSRLGKTVLWTAALDERFAVIIPILSGEGGASISRRKFGETIYDLTLPERYHYWYAPNYAAYADNVDALPVDGHMLLALAAPRPVLQIVGSEDYWSDPKGEFISSLAVAPVYRLFGKEGIDITEFPEPGTRSLKDMGYFIHDGGHKTLECDFEVMVEFMNKHFGR